MSERSEPDYVFDLASIAAALFASKGIKAGLWRLAVKVHFQAGVIDVNGVALPSGIVAFDSFALFREPVPGPNIFDAAVTKSAVASAVKPPSKRGAIRKKSRPSTS